MTLRTTRLFKTSAIFQEFLSRGTGIAETSCGPIALLHLLSQDEHDRCVRGQPHQRQVSQHRKIITPKPPPVSISSRLTLPRTTHFRQTEPRTLEKGGRRKEENGCTHGARALAPLVA